MVVGSTAASFVGNAFNRLSEQQHRPSVGYGQGTPDADPARFMGPGTGGWQINPYDGVSWSNYAYPEAVKDQHLLIRDSITGAIFEDIQWYTTVALPWAETDQVTIQWNEWNFDDGLAGREPYEGEIRLITSSKPVSRFTARQRAIQAGRDRATVVSHHTCARCGKAAEHRCPECKTAHYCGTGCQEADWHASHGAFCGMLSGL